MYRLFVREKNWPSIIGQAVMVAVPIVLGVTVFVIPDQVSFQQFAIVSSILFGARVQTGVWEFNRIQRQARDLGEALEGDG